MNARLEDGTTPAGGDRRKRDDALAWDPVASYAAYWTCYARSTDIWWTRRSGPRSIAARGRQRLASLIDFARERSPLYARLYRHLPSGRASLDALPVVRKGELMAHFDEWVTDRAVTLQGVNAFLADRAQIGERFLGRHYVWKSSGSTGVPGIFLQDANAVATYDALVLAQADPAPWNPDRTRRLLEAGARAALIAATGDHYASIASWQRVRRANPALQARSFSVLTPIADLVQQLNAYRPAFLASYPTVLGLLAQEREAGRLAIAPVRLWSGGECLSRPAHAAIERAFGCALANEYGASECLSIAYECRAGWLHVNADWVVLEPVDRDHRPVPPGTPSHTSLLTNLANRVQPIIRYDLGDSIVVHPDRCACGNPLPAIRVQGRRDEILHVRGAHGETVPLLPMALGTIIEEATGLHRFQIVQSAPDVLSVRLEARGVDERQSTWKVVDAALRPFLALHGLPNVTLELDRDPPLLDAGGKLRMTVVAGTPAPALGP